MPKPVRCKQAARGNVRGWRHTLGAAACAVALAWSAGAVAQQPNGQVMVRFGDSTQFAEARKNGRMSGEEHVAWLDELARHLAERAAPGLAPGERLDVLITDIDRAGESEPWRGPQAQDVRIVRDVYPPMIDLDFTLTGPDGVVRRQASEKLRDPAFTMRANRYFDDPLRYEKTLIDDWVDKTFPRRAG